MKRIRVHNRTLQMKSSDTISEIMLSAKNTWLGASIVDSHVKEIVNSAWERKAEQDGEEKEKK
ncbi:unnamed protein product [Sphenostylis stenocarpa]|uniref:Uncharacterized protein n=1 Tax=Sphenostylis stenocarpa TaxID=92480 RepID=A0AA86VQQ6_9FABA|nr:unnamed protein product [Sphenostylis stenocarpa]